MTSRFARLLVALLAVSVLAVACGETGMNKTTGGAIIGAGTGAVIGGVIGRSAGNTAVGAVVGGVAGGVAGGLIGRRMDQQAQELKQVPGMQEVNYNKETGEIATRMQVNFAYNSAEILPGEKQKLDSLAGVFAKYPENIVNVAGHTDSDGSDAYNKTLSEKRAKAVADYLMMKNPNMIKPTSEGFGESMPIASNDTPEGKAMNRRVEISIKPDPSRAPKQ